MKRREPPPLAMWMLEHLTPGNRDEALDGDLLEVFRLGRSNGWYWQQVAAACLVSWWNNLYARGPALVFALLWSMLSPVWYVTLERIETSQNFDKGEQIFGPFWLPLVLISWIVLHAIFVWAGLLIYRLVHAVLRKPLQKEDLRRAFWTVPLVLPLVYGATFLVANLYWYSLPGLANARLATTSWGQISDLGILANLTRFPYFVALLVGLWGTVHPVRHGENQLYVDSVSESGAVGDPPMPEPAAVQRFIAFMVAAGLVNSMIAATVLCGLPESHPIHLLSLFGNALKFVVIGALGGITGSWLYWKSPASPLRHRSPVPFSVFALTCAAGWVWVPAMMLLADQVSAAAAFVAMVGTFMLATGLRSATYFVLVPPQPKRLRSENGGLFSESLCQPPFELHGYAIALCLFAAGAAIEGRSNYTAAALLATGTFIFAWKNTVPRPAAAEREVQVGRAVRRAAGTAVPAILLTMWALLDGFAHGSLAGVTTNNEAHATSNALAAEKRPIAASGTGGFQSVVLWPYPEKKKIVPPLIADDSLLAKGTRRPLIIRFDGTYWFLQPPTKRPGPDAHVAEGTPVQVNIESNNALALMMNAHQKLASPIQTVRCREIEIAIENRDNRAGLISLGVLLTDESSSPTRTLYLGQQSIVSTELDHFFVKTTATYETLRFAVPPNAPLRKFNEITVIFLPDIEHTFVAPKIAIQQFELFPR